MAFLHVLHKTRTTANKQIAYHAVSLTLKVPSLFFINETRNTSIGTKHTVNRAMVREIIPDIVVDNDGSYLLIKYLIYTTENSKAS